MEIEVISNLFAEFDFILGLHNLFFVSFTTFITLKKEYFFLVDWFPVAPISDDWLGKDGVLPAEIVFLIQEDAEEAGEPNGETHEDEPEK